MLALLFVFVIGVHSYWIKMSSKYDTVTLIELVESRLCLWDKTSEEFKERELKSKLWLEVCSLLLGARLLTIGQKGANECR